MIDRTIEVLLILLLIFTPIAFGSQVLWAFSLMELGILLIIILWAVGRIGNQSLVTRSITDNQSLVTSNRPRITNNHVLITMVLLSLFLGIVLLQMIPLPSGVIKFISPRTYEIRHQLSVKSTGLSYQSSVHSSDDKLRITNNEFPVTDNGSLITNPQSPITNNRSLVTTLSLFPMGTKIEFFKWLTLAGLFIFLIHWRPSDKRYGITHHLVIAIFLVGVFESLYGIFEFFSGHRHVLNLDWSNRISSVTGSFVNRNYFAGYLLMVIPLSVGFLFSREVNQSGRFEGWRHRLSSLDGKTLLIGFGVILMILGLLLSASRMGILSLLISFSLMSLLFRDPHRGQRVSRMPILIFGLALVWAAWIGLDAVISRFFTVSEDLKSRWMLWGNTLRILKDFPFLGSGLGSFTQVFPMYRSFHIRGLITHAENDFLQLASEVGLCGAGLLLVLFLFLFFRAASGIRSLTSKEPQKYIGIGCLVGILALMFHSIVERNVQVPANAFLFTVIWAMALRISGRVRGVRLEGGGERVEVGGWREMEREKIGRKTVQYSEKLPQSSDLKPKSPMYNPQPSTYVFPFEKLDVWHMSLELADYVLGLLSRIHLNKHVRLVSQMEGAVTSIPQNIAEGKGRQYKREFIQYLSIAQGSPYEMITLNEIFKRRKLFTEKEAKDIRQRGEEIDRKLNGLMNAIRGRKRQNK